MKIKLKLKEGSALMIVMLTFLAIFILSFSSGYLVFLSISRSADSADSMRAYQASLAGIERAQFEAIENDYAFASSTCPTDIFSEELDNGSSYTINCIDNSGNLEFYSVGEYEKNQVALRIDCININEDCLPSCREGSLCGGEKLLATGGGSCSGCVSHEGLGYFMVLNETTGECWLDRNLGATQVATASNDAAAYGDLFQWGRATDGHQVRTSATTTTLATSDTPGHSNFILSSALPYDWRNPQNNNLWQGVDGINNPCPSGWRVPTETEWNAERLSWSSNNLAGAFSSPLKLTTAGLRDRVDGSLSGVGSYGYYWASVINGAPSYGLTFYLTNAAVSGYYRSYGVAVRCIKD